MMKLKKLKKSQAQKIIKRIKIKFDIK
jgi:hypothetical protein